MKTIFLKKATPSEALDTVPIAFEKDISSLTAPLSSDHKQTSY
jgi:hypothetical protein